MVEQVHSEIEHTTKFIGAYIMRYQSIENSLEQMLIHIMGATDFTVAIRILTKLSNADKIELTRSILNSHQKMAAPEQKGWLKEFEDIAKKLRKEGEMRNFIVHSAFITEFVQEGLPVVSQKIKSTKKGTHMQIKMYTPEHRQELYDNVHGLACSMTDLTDRLKTWDLTSDNSDDGK